MQQFISCISIGKSFTLKRRMKLLTMLLAGTVAFGTAAAPLTAMAATSGSYSITQPGTVNATKNVAYKISGVTKKQYAVVRVRGAAKTEVTVSKGSKNITSAVRSKSGYKMKGTGSTLSFKIKAKKTAVNKKYKVNVKIYNSASKKLVKKVSATSKVLVAATSVSLDSTTLSLKEGESKTLSYTLKPATSTDSVTYTSTNKTVAEVDNTGKVTAVAAGSATITATTTSGKTAICTVSVTAAQMPDTPDVPDTPDTPDVPDTPDTPDDGEVKEAADITATISNALADYTNTVLSTTNAELTVKVTDEDGRPVANKNVILTLGNNSGNRVEDYASGTTTGGMTTTDEKGTATFVLRDRNDKVTASAEYTVKAVGTEVEAKGVVKFATISLGTVSVLPEKDGQNNPTANFEKFALGTNAQGKSWSGGIRATTTLTGEESQYIASQQVSEKGTDEHALTMVVEPCITVPGATVSSNTVKTEVQAVPAEVGTSGKYGTYDKVQKTIVLDNDSSEVESAYLNFDYIRVSRYTSLKIEYYSQCRNGKVVEGSKVGDTETVSAGSKNLEVTNRGYQIPITSNGVKAVVITLQSEGQVNTDYEDGFAVKDITYTYKEKDAAEGSKTEALKGASITWETVTPVYTADKVLSTTPKTGDCARLGITPAAGHTYTYKMPVYPYTGNAVITDTDANGNVEGYYLAPTSNKMNASGGYENTNIITALDTNYNSGAANASDQAYKASAEEVNTILTESYTVADDGKTIVVNSEKTGSLNLKGTISVEGLGEKELSGLNEALYTSVHFNPTPKASAAEDRDAFLALAGQSVKVTAQLVDKNGNKVSTAGTGITINKGTGSAQVTDGTVDAAVPTNADGQVPVTFTAAERAQLIGMTATAADPQYDVVLSIGGKNVEIADIYWISAQLSFTPEVGGTPTTTTAAAPEKTVPDGTIQPTVTENWKYGVEAVSDAVADGAANGKLAGYSISIDGLKIKMTPQNASKGTYTDSDNGEVTAVSKKEGTDTLTASIDGNSIDGNLTFNVTNDGGRTTTAYTCVGEGNANLTAKLNMKVEWQATTNTVLSWYHPFGSTNASMANGTKTVYVKLADATGENALSGKTVRISAGDNAVLVGSVAASDGTVSAYESAKTNYEAGVGTYNTAKTTFDSKVTALETAAETELDVTAILGGSDADKKAVVATYNEAKTSFEAAVTKYETAAAAYADAIVEARTATATDYAAATAAYETAKEEFLAAVYTYDTTVKKAATDLGVTLATAGNDGYNKTFAAFIKADSTKTGVATKTGTVTVTGTCTYKEAQVLKYTDGTEAYAGNAAADAEKIPAGWYDATELATATTAGGSAASLTKQPHLTGLTLTGQVKGDTLTIPGYALDSADGGDVGTYADEVDTYTGLADDYSAAWANLVIPTASNYVDVTTGNDGYAAVTVKDPQGASTVLTATYTDGNQTAVATLNWNTKEALAVAQKEAADDVTQSSPKSITINFNNNLDAASVTKDMLAVDTSNTAGGMDAGNQKTIDSISVSGSKLTINFMYELDEKTDYYVYLKNNTKGSVTYMLTDENGYSIDNATFASLASFTTN